MGSISSNETILQYFIDNGEIFLCLLVMLYLLVDYL